MKKADYWKKYYVVETHPDDIEKDIKLISFTSEGETFELLFFEKDKNAPNILISPGSGGHAYVFAELGYQMYLKGYNIFIMPKHGSYSVNELIARHVDALKHISRNFNDRIGSFGEGLGGYVIFYLALAQGPVKSIVCQNSPAIMTEKEYHEAIVKDSGPWTGSAQRRKIILPLAKLLVRILPSLKLPISSYLDWKALIDTREENRSLETHLVADGYLNDPDFDRWYTLSAIMSLISTPPPNPITALKIPTMFLLNLKGPTPFYIKDLYNRLPPIKKKLVEIDGSVYWMLSHPRDEAKIVCEWFDETLY
ncbi:MAG: hypothetical protein AB1798_17460 [Spirochaetota bacterium]